jgi:hypothetical protein
VGFGITTMGQIEKTKLMLLSRYQNAGQNRDITIANSYSENASQ